MPRAVGVTGGVKQFFREGEGERGDRPSLGGGKEEDDPAKAARGRTQLGTVKTKEHLALAGSLLRTYRVRLTF